MGLSIAEWDPGYYPDINTADGRQQRCYRKIRSLLDRGKMVEVNGNDAYLYYYNIELHSELCQARNDHQLQKLREANDIFIRNYSDIKPKVVSYFYVDLIFIDLLLFLDKDDDKILHDLNRLIHFCIANHIKTNAELVITAYIAAGHLTESSYINPSVLPALISSSLRMHMTKVGKENERNVVQTLFDFLNADYEYSLKNFLYNMYDFADGVAYLDSYGCCRCEPISEAPNSAIKAIYGVRVPIYNDVKLKAFLRSSVRESENIYRNSIGLQEIGQGWVSETLLFRRVEAALPNTVIEQHSRPSFLGRQHYDVYVPAYKIALEYQGDQHYSAIEFFGGKGALKQNRERDARKRLLSKKNGVTQIDVHPGYSLEELIRTLGDILRKHGVVIDNSAALERARSIQLDRTSQDKKTLYRKASRKVSKTIQKSLSDDNELTRKAEYLLSRVQIEPCKPADPHDIFSVEELMEFDGLFISTFPVNETSTEDSIKILQSMIDRGYLTASVFGDLANKYHKIGNYRMELLTMLRAQKKYGWDFMGYIKPLLKSQSDAFEDLFEGWKDEY